MYGFVGKMVFCKFHPHKRCEHFCEEHTVLLCSICLREKHRACTIADEREFKDFYARKIRDAGRVIEDEKNDIIDKTDGVVHALDTGIVRLAKYQKDVDGVLKRLHEMKNEVEHQRNGIRFTSQSLRDIERSLTTANELKQCKQLYSDVDIERIKFERKQQKIVLTPGRFHDEIKIHFNGLTKKLKTIRNDVHLELTASQEKLQLKQNDSVVKPFKEFSYNPPYMNISKKYAKVRGRTNKVALLASFSKVRKPITGDDGRIIHEVGRFTNYRYDRTVRLPALPGITDSTTKQPVVSFAGMRRQQNSAKSDSWHMT